METVEIEAQNSDTTANEVIIEEAVTEAAPATDKITDLGEIEQVLEAIIFAAPKSMSLVRLRNLLNHFNFDTSSLSDTLQSIMDRTANSGFQLVKAGSGYQFRTHPKHADVMQKLLEDKPTRLSNSALEVLAIVGYKQPLTRSEVDAIRGTDSGHLMKGLLEKNLVRTAGHAETPGRPLLYETTPYFLEVFTMSSLDDLPQMEEFNRELQENPEASNDNGGFNVFAADPGFFDKASPLAANPDRGEFDKQNEDAVELPDFGSAETAANAEDNKETK